jgi:uncharacterized membrane protein YbhN (UPF0104 family)
MRDVISLVILLVWIATLGFIAWKIWEARDALIPYIHRVNYAYFFGVFIGYIASLVASIIGWSTIMHRLDKSISWFKHAQIFTLTLFWRRLPGTIWYVGGRMFLYNQLGVPNRTILLASGLELTLAIVTGGLIGLVFLMPFGINIPSQIIILLIIVAIIIILVLHPKALKLVFKQDDLTPKEIIRPRDILVWSSIYIVMWIFGGFMLGQLVAAFNSIELAYAYKFIGVWALAGTAGLLTFFLPSTFGATEVTITALLAQTMPLPLAGVIAILTRILTTVFEIVLGIVFYPLMARQRTSSR